MADWDDVRRIALELPQTSERPGHTTQWRVKDTFFVWERPLRTKDRADLGAAAPPEDAPILAARIADEGVKHALIADDPDVYFTTPHFNGYPAILVRLDRIEIDELTELITEAWLQRAPKRVKQAYLDAHPFRTPG
ncbi:MAG TPA: MmcQ/YjbR family DNA-binding protein [Jatrophihabitans sp.]|nr:MmcQ/YjbR family DNA-binding protein [Jatrophihabitans sp.]